MQAALGRTLALSGKREEALRILQNLHTLGEKRYVSPFELASVYFVLGQNDENFRWLAKAFHDRCFELISLRVDPRLQLALRFTSEGLSTNLHSSIQFE